MTGELVSSAWWGILMKSLRLKIDRELGFEEARYLAKREAGEYLGNPLILSWLNRKTGKHSPDVDCCQEDGKETWEIYAESRGGTIRVELDDQYVFIFREGLR
jgi:hypothetical protein